MFHKLSTALLLAACCGALSTLPLSADTLEDLLTGGSLTVGDVTFSDFTYSVSCTSGAGDASTVAGCGALTSGGGSPYSLITGIDPNGITISPDTVGGLVGWELTGGPTVYEYNGVATTLDITLTYDATVNDSSEISDVNLGAVTALNPPCTTGQTCAPNPSVSIGETVDDQYGNFLGNLEVTNPPPVLSDAITISPVSGVSVTKDIDLNSGTGTNGGVVDYAGVSTISQQLSEVPEPRALSLALGLLIGMVFVVRRRRQQTA